MESTFLGCFSGSMIRGRIYVFRGMKIGFENLYRQIAMTSVYSSNLLARFFWFFKMVGLAGEEMWRKNGGISDRGMMGGWIFGRVCRWSSYMVFWNCQTAYSFCHPPIRAAILLFCCLLSAVKLENTAGSNKTIPGCIRGRGGNKFDPAGRVGKREIWRLKTR